MVRCEAHLRQPVLLVPLMLVLLAGWIPGSSWGQAAGGTGGDDPAPDPAPDPVGEQDAAPEKAYRLLRPTPAELAGAPQVKLVIVEKIGEPPAAPDSPWVARRLQDFFADLAQPMALVEEFRPASAEAGDDDGKAVSTEQYQLEVNLSVRFLRTHKMYGEMPVLHIFEAKATCQLTQLRGKKKPKKLGKLPVIDEEFSTSVDQEKSHGLGVARQETLRHILHHLSKLEFLRKRGAVEVPLEAPDPEEDESGADE